MSEAAPAAKPAAMIQSVSGWPDVAAAFRDPPAAYRPMPFWFWNDALAANEIVRQIAEMEEHGVYGFVIHPRVGLPR